MKCIHASPGGVDPSRTPPHDESRGAELASPPRRTKRGITRAAVGAHMLLQIALLFVASAAAVLATPDPANAVDRPIATTRLLLRDQTHPKGARVVFRAVNVPALASANVPDPRVSGATLEIVGNGPGDGASGIIPLPPSGWQPLDPPGSGYRYVDPAKPSGIRRVEIRTTRNVGSLRVVGVSRAWPYRVTQAQGPINVRLTIGDAAFCARSTTYAANGPGRTLARNAPAPQLCFARTVRCGNRVVEGTESCDDGNPNAGDGCTPQCVLTDSRGLCAGVPRAIGDEIASELVVAGLASPVYLAAPPLDTQRLFIVEQEGRVRIVRNGALLPIPFLDITDKVSFVGERGLFSIAFHPDYASNRRFFVY